MKSIICDAITTRRIASSLALVSGDSVESGTTPAALHVPVTGPDGTLERCIVEGSSWTKETEPASWGVRFCVRVFPHHIFFYTW